MNKKLVSLLIIVALSLTMLVACNSSNTDKAYNLAKEQSEQNANMVEESLNGMGTVDFIKEDNGIGILIIYEPEYLNAILSYDPLVIYNSLIAPNLSHSASLRQQLDRLNYTDVNSFIRFESDGTVLIEIINGELVQLNLGNEEYKQVIWDAVNSKN